MFNMFKEEAELILPAQKCICTSETIKEDDDFISSAQKRNQASFLKDSLNFSSKLKLLISCFKTLLI